MTKKEYVITLLRALEGKWSLAHGLLVLVEGNVFSDETLSTITQIFIDALKGVNDKQQRDQLEKSIDYLEVLKVAEHKDTIVDNAKLDALLGSIDD